MKVKTCWLPASLTKLEPRGLAGRGALRVAAAARKLRAQLLVVQDQPLPSWATSSSLRDST